MKKELSTEGRAQENLNYWNWNDTLYVYEIIAQSLSCRCACVILISLRYFLYCCMFIFVYFIED